MLLLSNPGLHKPETDGRCSEGRLTRLRQNFRRAVVLPGLCSGTLFTAPTANVNDNYLIFFSMSHVTNKFRINYVVEHAFVSPLSVSIFLKEKENSTILCMSFSF